MPNIAKRLKAGESPAIELRLASALCALKLIERDVREYDKLDTKRFDCPESYALAYALEQAISSLYRFMPKTTEK